MANRSTHPIYGQKTELQLIYGRATGAGAADLTGHDDDLVSSTRTGVGVHTLVFRHSYPIGVMPIISCFGSTVGLVGQFSAWDPVAKTATLVLTDAGVAADAAAGDSVRIAMLVRNSNRND